MGPEEEVIGDWMQLHNEELCDAWYRWHIWGKSDTHLRVLVAKHEEKRPLLKT